MNSLAIQIRVVLFILYKWFNLFLYLVVADSNKLLNIARFISTSLKTNEKSVNSTSVENLEKLDKSTIISEK